VYWDRYGGLLIELADQELNAVPIDQDIKRLVKQRKMQDCGWFIV
jgi:hypothetical protein